MRDWLPLIRRIARLWPEAVLGAFTIWLVLADGLRTSAGDPGYYYKIAGQVSQGMIPWRDFPFEYPPVSLLPVLLPYFLPGGTASYETYLRLLFSENVLLVVATGLGVVWLARRGWSSESWLRSGIIYGLLTLTLAPVVVWRYEPVPVLLTVAGVMFAARYQSAASGVALGTAVIAKLYPLAMLPALMLGQIRDRGLRPALVLAGVCVVTAVALAAPFVLIAGRGAFSYIEYATTRGVQIESVPGGMALLASALGGPSARVFHGFGTWQVDSPLIPILGSLWTVLTGVAVLALGLAIWQRFKADRLAVCHLRPTSQVTHLLAALTLVLVSSRILSPQYLFWVVPFVALGDRPKALVFWVACLLTTFVYPLNYQQLLNQEAYTVIATNIRNAILVGFLGWVIAGELRFAIRAVMPRVRTLAQRSRPDSPAA